MFQSAFHMVRGWSGRGGARGKENRNLKTSSNIETYVSHDLIRTPRLRGAWQSNKTTSHPCLYLVLNHLVYNYYYYSVIVRQQPIVSIAIP